MADKHLFADELTEEKVTTLVENATSTSHLEGNSFSLNTVVISDQIAIMTSQLIII